MRKPKANLRKRGATWYYAFQLAGKRTWKSTGESDQAKAQKIANEALGRALRRSDDNSLDAATAPMSQLIDAFIARKRVMRKANTVELYYLFRKRLEEYFGEDTPLAHINRQQVERWRDWLTDQRVESQGRKDQFLSRKTISEHMGFLASLYKFYELPNPVALVERPAMDHAEKVEALKFYTVDEISDLREAAREMISLKRRGDWQTHYRWLVIISGTGARLGEVHGIRIKDIDLEGRRLALISSKTGKLRNLPIRGSLAMDDVWRCLIKQYREVADPLIEKIRTELEQTEPHAGLKAAIEQIDTQDIIIEDWALERRVASELIKRYGERPIFRKSPEWSYKMLGILCKWTGVQFKGIHALRHGFATIALHQGWELGQLAQWLGHANINITYGTYTHLTTKNPPAIEIY